MSEKRVYTFGNGQAEGNAQMRERLGGKGANLAEMNLIGIPVPPGFTIATDVCNEYYEVGQEKIVEILQAEVNAAVAHVENLMNSKFGSTENPLLVSVRSGARASMPGMMDTILNLGLNDEVAEGMVRKTGTFLVSFFLFDTCPFKSLPIFLYFLFSISFKIILFFIIKIFIFISTIFIINIHIV